ncbi:MAG: PEP/pyruvate-binding domain-containing protein [Planctomycetota bacterium]
MAGTNQASIYPAFDRNFLNSDEDFSVIGGGALGGKATGLAFVKRIIAQSLPPNIFSDVEVRIPRLAVVGTDVFEQFMEQNGLYEIALSDAPDARIAHVFQKAELPPHIVGDLRALIVRAHQPLAVRSSSLLEDALQHPFAGTYGTKMIPNNQPAADARFQRLVEAIKFVYASTFFRDARSYMQAIGQASTTERMAVIIQEVVGQRFNERFYPTVSGVVRTHNSYARGHARPEDGVTNLALGLGKTIVDGGVTWSYCPKYPGQVPPFGSLGDLLKNTQTTFWAVNMGSPPPHDPISETEYLLEAGLDAAEYDDTLRRIASTYDPGSDRLRIGTGAPGPRVLTFAPLLELDDVPLNALILRLAEVCRAALDTDVEIEFAMSLDRRGATPAHRFGFLQLRPMLVSAEQVAVAEADLADPAALVASERVLGNGVWEHMSDVVYVKPGAFEARRTSAIAAELASINRALSTAGRPYVLIGFGRWGSSDQWLGIPVTWPQISAARAIVEAMLPQMNVEPSQGTHFFHNLTSFRVPYFTVRQGAPDRIDWGWLDRQPAVSETDHVRHVVAPGPLRCRVDGHAGRGVILRP